MTIVWLNGTIFDESSAGVGPLDPGLLVGDGVFSTVAVYGGAPFVLDRHLDRLDGSVAALGLGTLDRARVHEAITKTLRIARLDDIPASRLRITLWRSASEMGLFPEHSSLSLSVAVTATNGPGVGSTEVPFPRVLSSRFIRNEKSPTAGHKSTSYADNAYALREARQRGFDEAILFTASGELSEGTTSNVIVEIGGELLTPALNTGCLPGITRSLALEWAADAGLPIREAKPGELTEGIVGRPAALLGTLRNVAPVSAWNDVALPRGPLISELVEVFAQRSLEAHVRG